jgi:hydroxymethylpyrimidine/phosphomethylpyrimidine kinase
VDVALIREQAKVLIEDIAIDVIKVGMIPSIEVLQEVILILRRFPTKPVVFDPVLSSGGGYIFGSNLVIESIVKDLLPRCLVITPNTNELIALSKATHKISVASPPDVKASALSKFGVNFVLLTGTHADRKDVENSLFDEGGLVDSWTWPRLTNQFHGSGCTLASAIAAFLAKGLSVPKAASRAQQYTWDSLNRGFSIGSGQLIPNRIYGSK